MFVRLFLVSFLAAIACAHAGTVSCTLSGDPHYKTFDGSYHDFMGLGTYQLVENPWFNVQAILQYCNGGSAVRPITCVRKVAVQVKSPRGVATSGSVVSWGSWYGQIDTITFEGQDYPADKNFGKKSTTAYPGYVVEYVAASRVMKFYPSDPVNNAGPTITWSFATVSITLPDTDERFKGGSDFVLTNGLCGRYDGDFTNEYTSRSTLTPVFVSSRSRVTQSAQVQTLYNTWGPTWSVGASFPLGSLFSTHPTLMSNGQWVELQDAPTPSVPDAGNVTALNNLVFAGGIAAMNAAQVACAQQGATDDVLVNCMYDHAAAQDPALAATNVAAAQAAAADAATLNPSSTSSSSDNSSAAAIAGGVVGGVCALAIIIAAVMYFKLRRAKADYSRALILRNQGNAGATSHSPSGNVEVAHADNL